MNNPYDVLKPDGIFNVDDFESLAIDVIKKQVCSDEVLLALSGGVDSSVCAALLAKAIPGKLHCIFVDTGLMRKNEGNDVEAAFRDYALNLVCVNAEERFFTRLAGVTCPESKRKIIGEEFIRVFEESAKSLLNVKFLAQDTIYPDIAESGLNGTPVVKSHHNVGGLPDNIAFKELVEPLRSLHKHEVRKLGRHLVLPAMLVDRQPFPGPGLAVRCIGEVTKKKISVLREADTIFCEEIETSGVIPNQYFAVLSDTRSVGVSDNSRVYGHVIALRAVETTDFMTASYTQIPHDVLARISHRITSTIPSVTRVVYDITNKPPATIEWE